MAWYSDVSGAPCNRPGGFVGSNRPTPREPSARTHWPLQSGYFASSPACAPTAVAHSAANIEIAPIVLRSSMVILPDTWSLFSASAHRYASSRADARIGFEAGRLDARDPAFLVVLRSVAGEPDRADDLVCAIADQNPANDRHEPAAACRRERGEK